MSANAVLFGTTTLYRVAANQLRSVHEMLSQCPRSGDLEDILADLDAITLLLSHDMQVPTTLTSEVADRQEKVNNEQDKELKVIIAANHAVSQPVTPPSTVKVGPFTIQTTIPDDHKLKMLGTPILVAYAKHFGVEDRSSKDAMITGLQQRRDQRQALKPFDLTTLRITSAVKAEMMQRRWTQKDVDAFCKGAKIESVDATLFVQELSDVIPNDRPEPKPITIPDTITKDDKPQDPTHDRILQALALEVKVTKTGDPLVKSTTNKQKPPANDAETEAAQKCGLNLIHYRILRALEDGKEHTYRQIEAKTGYYSILTAQLRVEKMGSLGNKGLVTEGVFEIDGKDKLAFTITKAGITVLKKAK